MNKNLECLLPDTAALLQTLIDTAPFLQHYAFVGGSALALHVCHRKSEDLDFFTYEQGVFDKHELLRYVKRFETVQILNESHEQLDLLIEGVKVTFFDAAWDFLKPLHVKPFNLATLESIAAMKVNVLFLRAKYRDYYDLYFLAKEMGIKKMFEVSKKSVEGLTYKLLCVSLLYIDDIEDDNIAHLEPKEMLDLKTIRAYFEARM